MAKVDEDVRAKRDWQTMVAAILTLAGLASLVLSVVPMPVLPHMLALGLLALFSAAGLYRRTRWGLPLSLSALAFHAAVGLTATYVFWTLYTTFGETPLAAISAVAGVLTALATLLFFYILSRRGLAGRAEPQPA